MPTLYRPDIVSYRLPNGAYRTPDGKRVTSKTPGAVRHKSKSPTWWGRYTDGAGQEHQVRLSHSKETARRMLNKLAGDGELASVGIKDRFSEQEARPLLEHLEDFARFLKAKGDTEKHARKVRRRCLAIIEGIEAERIGELEASAVQEYLGNLREQGVERADIPTEHSWLTRGELAAALGVNPDSLWRILKRDRLTGPDCCRGNGKARRFSREVALALQDRLCRGSSIGTVNNYLTAIKSFTRWLVRDRRAASDPLVCLSRMNVDTDRRVIRRALEPAVLARLIEAARTGRPYRGLSGTDRAALYLLASRTGLRASELASLTPASFDLAGPTVTVQARYSKRRRLDVQLLPPTVAEAMATHIRGRPRKSPLWLGTWADTAAEMLRIDLEAAGIPYVDADGLVYDFHALRHQFISDLAAAGVHPKDAQVLARHSTITLTMDHYTHVRQSSLQAALDRLPDLDAAKQAEDGRTAETGARRVQGA
jgi:integrase